LPAVISTSFDTLRTSAIAAIKTRLPWKRRSGSQGRVAVHISKIVRPGIDYWVSDVSTGNDLLPHPETVGSAELLEAVVEI